MSFTSLIVLIPIFAVAIVLGGAGILGIIYFLRELKSLD